MQASGPNVGVVGAGVGGNGDGPGDLALHTTFSTPHDPPPSPCQRKHTPRAPITRPHHHAPGGVGVTVTTRAAAATATVPVPVPVPVKAKTKATRAIPVTGPGPAIGATIDRSAILKNDPLTMGKRQVSVL